jgi:hypothetical protein
MGAMNRPLSLAVTTGTVFQRDIISNPPPSRLAEVFRETLICRQPYQPDAADHFLLR